VIQTLEAEVQALEGLDLHALRAEWRRRYGAPPRLRSAELLRYVLAWRIQAASLGDLDPLTRKRLRMAGAPGATSQGLRPGVTLAREWQGRRIEVTVADAGFIHEGRAYPSLSAVARQVTGVRWNGPRFFGLRVDGRA